jgi:hypothetical protein
VFTVRYGLNFELFKINLHFEGFKTFLPHYEVARRL